MKVSNKQARRNYTILDKFEAGIVLTGAEAKAARSGAVDLHNSYAKIIDGEAYLVNMNLTRGMSNNFEPTRTRKLLLHKDEIVSILTKVKAKKLTIVPLSMYTKGRLIKAKIALAKSKRKFEKKEAIKKKDIERDIQRQLRGNKDI
ncbi:MAG: SsrA-binding protein [Candidatus Woesebacteria bacterium GW2011_GWA1_39_8]|jgi:SsrA-binding protein|uniref:SsrA-binding protein n=1 Tax=Candidatus Woesebacteria bacterium GW2011_GWA1_39_8 TaxID=1618552 RepID=A0A0G0PNA3_9BACT|nr:MAG: SsrA-binding protein [Candidatus Woesebacteria bacterium GW2011_GWA1_39_8]